MVWIGLHHAGLMSLMFYCLTYLKCNEEMKVKRAIIRFKLMESKPCIDGTYPIYLIVQYNGRAVYSVGERCSVKDWNGGECRNVHLMVKLNNLKMKVERYRDKLILSGIPYTCSSLLDVLKRDDIVRDRSRALYYDVMNSILHKRCSAPKTCQSHLYAYRVIAKFMKKDNFMVIELNEGVIRRWIRSVENTWKPLSIKSVLARVLDVWRSFIADGGDRTQYPFDSIRVSSFKSEKVKQIMNIEQIKALRSYYSSSYIYNKVYEVELMNRNSECFALTCYLLSFSMFGLALVDLLKLKVSSIEECKEGWMFTGVRRSKTKTPVPLFIVRDEITSIIMPLLIESANLREGYLLPGIQNNGGGLLSDTDERISFQVSNVQRIVNRNLKSVWRKTNNLYNVNIPLNYTFYSMRSSAASIYLSKDGANIYTLAHLMGRSVEGISTYVADIKSSEQLMKERMKLIL